MWWNKTEASGVERVLALAERDPLVTSFGDGLVVVAMDVEPDGYLVSWTLRISPGRTLPEVELFIAKVASFIEFEPVE